MRAFNKIVIAAAAVTIAFAGPVGVAGAASPFAGLGAGSLGSLGALFPTPEEPGPVDCTVNTGDVIHPAGMTVVADKTTCLVDGDKITVTGTGFSGENFGIYVGLVQDSQYSVTEADLWMGTKWVNAASIVGGAWSVELDVTAVNEAKGTDCTENACSIRTMSAHGNPDRTQDTKTPVTFE